MSELRQPTEIWVKRLPRIEGKKSPKNCNLKIELFPAYYWAMDWEPGSVLFHPRPPLRSFDRQHYWEANFRARVNGKWLGGLAKYQFFTKQQIAETYFK